MENKKVSLVLPVYNVEAYLDRCLESIVGQTYQNLEIILINDGSADASPRLCEAWKEKDSRIRVLHQENIGLGLTRNRGLHAATGDYLIFVDSDDYIAPNTVEDCCAAAEAARADVVLYGMSLFTEGQILQRIVSQMPKNVYTGSEVQEVLLPCLIGRNPETGRSSGLCMSMSTCMLSLPFLRALDWQIVSEREYVSEDFFSLLTLYTHVQTVCILPEAYYFYYQNLRSLSHSFRPDRMKRLAFFHQEACAFCLQSGYNEAVRDNVTCLYFSDVIGHLKTLLLSDLPVPEKKRYLREIVSDSFLQSMLTPENLSREPLLRRLLLIAARRKLYPFIYWMVKAKL